MSLERERPEEMMTKPPIGSSKRSENMCSWNCTICSSLSLGFVDGFLLSPGVMESWG